MIHLTTGRNIGNMGDRIPGVWVTNKKEMYVMFAINGNGNFYKSVGKVEENKLIKVEISQKATMRRKLYLGHIWIGEIPSIVYNFEVLLNGRRVWLVENRTPALYDRPKIYVGDPWHPALDGYLTTLRVESSHCPSEWRAVGDKCYYTEESKMGFTEAQSFCKFLKANLLLAKEEKERQGLTKKFADLTSRKLRFWIDAKIVDGSLHTGNGEKQLQTSAADWGDLPNNRAGDCVRTGPDFKWYRASCHSRGEPDGYTWNPMCVIKYKENF